MNKEIVREMVQSLGWDEIDSKNIYMMSFVKDNDGPVRLNVYFTTGTCQVQTTTRQEVKKLCTLSDIEELINKY